MADLASHDERAEEVKRKEEDDVRSGQAKVEDKSFDVLRSDGQSEDRMMETREGQDDQKSGTPPAFMKPRGMSLIKPSPSAVGDVKGKGREAEPLDGGGSGMVLQSASGEIENGGVQSGAGQSGGLQEDQECKRSSNPTYTMRHLIEMLNSEEA
jgi:hypothetical protein